MTNQIQVCSVVCIQKSEFGFDAYYWDVVIIYSLDDVVSFSNLFEIIKLLAGSGCVRVLKIVVRAALHHALHNVCV